MTIYYCLLDYKTESKLIQFEFTLSNYSENTLLDRANFPCQLIQKYQLTKACYGWSERDTKNVAKCVGLLQKVLFTSMHFLHF